MSFCNKATKAIRHIMDQVTPELGVIVAEITKYTGLIKALEANPTVDAIVQIIPGGSKVEGWLNVALDEITGAATTVQTLAEKLSGWLDSAPTQVDRESKLLNIATVAAKAADVEMGNPAKSKPVYDSAVLLRIMADKHE